MKKRLFNLAVQPIILGILVLFYGVGCSSTKETVAVIEFSIGFEKDSIELYRNDSLLIQAVVTTNYSIGQAKRIELGYNYNRYKIMLGARDSVEVNLSDAYPVAYICKDSISTKVYYYKKELEDRD